MTKPDCDSCSNQYQGADLVKRCRVVGLKCFSGLADGCKKYEREAGSDDWDIAVTLCAGCVGRGD